MKLLHAAILSIGKNASLCCGSSVGIQAIEERLYIARQRSITMERHCAFPSLLKSNPNFSLACENATVFSYRPRHEEVIYKVWYTKLLGDRETPYLLIPRGS